MIVNDRHFLLVTPCTLHQRHVIFAQSRANPALFTPTLYDIACSIAFIVRSSIPFFSSDTSFPDHQCPPAVQNPNMSVLQKEIRRRTKRIYPAICECDIFGGVEHEVKDRFERWRHEKGMLQRQQIQLNNKGLSDPIGGGDIDDESNSKQTNHDDERLNEEQNALPHKKPRFESRRPLIQTQQRLESAMRQRAIIEQNELRRIPGRSGIDFAEDLDQENNGSTLEGTGDLSEEEHEILQEEYPELFGHDVSYEGFEEAASTLLSPYEICRHLNQVLLSSLGHTDFPFGQTKDHCPNKIIIDSFDYFRLKNQHNMTTTSIEDLFAAIRRNVPTFEALSMDQIVRQLSSYTGFGHVRYDCCIDTCVCFVSEFSHHESCPVCDKPRFLNDKVCTFHSQIPNVSRANLRLQPLCTFDYQPIIHRLRAIWADPRTAKTMKRYRGAFPPRNATQTPETQPPTATTAPTSTKPKRFTDFWSGKLYEDLVTERQLLTDIRDIGFIFTTDGLQLFKIGNYEIWPLFLLNLNLPRRERVKKENIIPVGFIPGPKSPGDLDSFLRPLIDELLILHNGVSKVNPLYPMPKYIYVIYLHINRFMTPAPTKHSLCAHMLFLLQPISRQWLNSWV